MSSRLQDVLLRGLRSAQPLATDVATGTLYYVTDEGVTEQSDGSAWNTYSGTGGGGGGIALAAGTQVATSGTVNFGNANGVTFGMSGSTAVTASVNTNYAGTGITTATTTGSVLVGTNSSNGLSLGVPVWITAGGGGGSVNISAGTTSNNLTALTFSNGSGVSFGLNGSVITATVQTNYLTTAMASNRASDFVAATAAFAGTNASGTINSTGISVSVAPPSAGSVNVSAGTTSSNLTQLRFIDSNGVSFGLNGVSLSATVRTNYQSSGAYLTTAALSQDSSKYAGTAGAITGGSITVNTSGVSVNLPAYLTTAMASNGGSNFVQATAVFAGTNASGTIASGGISVSVAAPGGGGAITFSAGTSSGSLNSVVFSDSGAISFGLSGSTITASANTVGTATTYYPVASANSVGTVTRWAAEDHRHAGIGAIGISTSGNTSGTTGSVQGTYWFQGSNAVYVSQITSNNGSHTLVISGGPATLSSYEPMVPAPGLSTALVALPTVSSASVSIFPFVIEEYVSAGILNLPVSVNFLTLGTSSGRQTCGLAVGLYTQNVSTLSSLASSSFSYGVTGNNSTYSISQVTATNYTGYGAMAQTSSAGVNITSGYTGMKQIGIPINALMSPGQYYLAILGTNSTSSTNVGLSFSLLGAAMGTGLSGMAPIGSLSTAYSTGQDPYGRWEVGQGIWTTATNVTMLPASMALASISAAAATYPLMRFWRT